MQTFNNLCKREIVKAMDVPDTAVASDAARFMCSDSWLNHGEPFQRRPRW
jgi:hypothetical protein